jgi:hypothetical protein
MAASDPTSDARSRDTRHIPSPRARNGRILGSVGVVVYAIGTALPYLGTTVHPSPSILSELFHAIPGSGAAFKAAAVIGYYGVVVIVAVIYIQGSRTHRWDRAALALLGASTIALIPVVVEIIRAARFGAEGYGPGYFALGARVMDLGIICAFTGGVIAIQANRSTTSNASAAEGTALPMSYAALSDRHTRWGLTLVLAATLGFGLASLLPYYRTDPSMFVGSGFTPTAQGLAPTTLASGLFGSGVLGLVERIPRIYGAAVIVAIGSIVGLRGHRRDQWAVALLGATATWTSEAALALAAYGRVPLIGLWLTQLCILVALVGSVIAVWGSRRANTDAIIPIATP